MIKLGYELPDAIEVGGISYRVKTDYRIWIRLPEMNDYRELFIGDNPSFFGYFSREAIVSIKEFYLCGKGSSDGNQEDQLMDFEQDSGRIYASFLQAYNIDLFEVELHWHKFLTLLQNLPEWTTLSKVISIRAYKGDDEKLNKLKDSYAIERELTEAEERAGEYFEEVFG